MTRAEFATVLAHLKTGLGCKDEKPAEEKARAEVYYDILGTLPLATFQLAAKRVMCERVYPTLPSPAELLQAASEVSMGWICPLVESDAWKQALAFAKVGPLDRYGTNSAGESWVETMGERFNALHPVVRECVERFGMRALEDVGPSSIGYARNAFGKVFAEVNHEHKRRAMLPASIAKAIESNKPTGTLPAATVKAISRIGVETEPAKKGRTNAN